MKKRVNKEEKLSLTQKFYLKNSANMDAIEYLYDEEKLSEYGFKDDEINKIEFFIKKLKEDNFKFLNRISGFLDKYKELGFKNYRHRNKKEISHRAIIYKNNVGVFFKFKLVLQGCDDSFCKKPSLGMYIAAWANNLEKSRSLHQSLYNFYSEKKVFTDKKGSTYKVFNKELYDKSSWERGWSGAGNNHILYMELEIDPAKDTYELISKKLSDAFENLVGRYWGKKLKSILVFENNQ